MTFRSSGLAAILLMSASSFAIAQSQPPPAMMQAQPDAPPMLDPHPKAGPATGPHNSTTGAASTDVPMPSVVVHIPSGADAAKFNAAADADDKKPTLAHAFALTDEQKKLIASSVAGAPSSGRPDFKPEVAALAPASATLADLAPAITAKIPYLTPYKVAVIDNQILLVDPTNSNVVVSIINQ